MRLVRVALTRRTRVRMHISNDCQTLLLADVPEPSKITALEAHDTAIKHLWIQVVVENSLSDPCSATSFLPEQKGSAFVVPAASAP